MSELAIVANVDPSLSATVERAGRIEQGSFAAEAPLGRVMNDQGHAAGTSLLA